MALRRGDIPKRFAFRELYPPGRTWVNPGGSAIVDPDGAIVAGPMQEEEGLLVAEIDLGRVRGPRWILDVAGHYARPDVFQLTVRQEEQPMLRLSGPRPVVEPVPRNERTRRPRKTATPRKPEA
jgi:nitrilase